MYHFLLAKKTKNGDISIEIWLANKNVVEGLFRPRTYSSVYGVSRNFAAEPEAKISIQNLLASNNMRN